MVLRKTQPPTNPARASSNLLQTEEVEGPWRLSGFEADAAGPLAPPVDAPSCAPRPAWLLCALFTCRTLPHVTVFLALGKAGPVGCKPQPMSNI